MGIVCGVDRQDLKAGDHIFSYRAWYTYAHHGIYDEENNMVIHYTRTQPESLSHAPTEPASGGCDICNYQPKAERGVVACCLDCFLNGSSSSSSLNRFGYGVSPFQFLVSRIGTCSLDQSDAPEVVVRRARQMLIGDDDFGEYHLLDNNCESFATYCKTRKRLSFQAESLKSRAIFLKHKPFSFQNLKTTVAGMVFGYKVVVMINNHFS
ncbi:protein LEAD-SENSITIVE 1-like [Humulus lupulus]|uniref:protein LEAD-SENSITIVE 1-like n=1 Tax=Humulus lupulus TaxID=3486 RepID=UPI002B408CB3|nr:protein LEAD-SENSITIVE 1-like [Humulus lupulus]